MARREAIADALFQRTNAAAGKVEGLKTSSRTLRSFDQVGVKEMPALFQAQRPETVERTVKDGPPKRTMHFELWLYTAENQTPKTIPSQQLNNMTDAIETALAPDPLTGKLTLGGLCAQCWLEGAIEFYEGVSQEGKAIAIIPVAVLIP